MTVRELIEELKQEPPDLMVVVRGYEDGYDDPDIRRVVLIPDSNWEKGSKKDWYFGRHDSRNSWGDELGPGEIEAIAV